MLFRFVLLLLAFFVFHTSLYALKLSVNVGREDGQSFSTLHIKEQLPFKCLSEADEFDELKQVQCVFPREPKEKFEPFETNYFKIDSFTQKGKYILRVYPLEKMYLIPIASRLYEKAKMYKPEEYKRSEHWMIVGYKEKLPLIKISKTPARGIDFPLEMAEIMMPSVGALDIDGNPIRLDKLGDVSAYMHIKKAYESGKYDELSTEVDELFKEYPQTIFSTELLLYKIRGLHHMGESEALLEVSKKFIYEYSDDENMGEVLAYTANAYSEVGLQADASYFFERLFKEYAESRFASLGMVFLGDQFISSGKQKQAEVYFEKALYITKDVEIASMAAIRLAKLSLEKGLLEKSASLYEKIIEGNAKYLLHDVEENYDTARAFANRGDKKTAADILAAVTQYLPKNDNNYEEMIRDIGIWRSETKDKFSAYTALKKYQQMYGESDYSEEVQAALDSLFYVPEDANTTALLAEYENLETKYAGQEIGQKAALHKAKLYYTQKLYQDVLDMNGSGVEEEEEYADLRQGSAQILAMGCLERGECAKAIGLRNEYNLSLEQKFDKSLYTCAYKTGNYFLAKITAAKHLKDKDERLKWLYNYAKTLNKSGQYEELTKVAADVITLSEMEKSSDYDDILQDLFYAYERLGNTQGMIKTVKELEKRRGLEYDDIEIYVNMIKLGLNENDTVIIQTYADKVMRLQEKTNSYSQSPFVEFAALQVLKEQKKEKEQLALLDRLVKRDLNDKEKSRVQYMYGSLLMKSGKKTEAKAAFEASIKVDETSAWAGLSKDALELVE